ncbi:MAG: LamG domain-containing protein, partial [Thermoplasmata archaeon]|nr:LamG domain-containing protein [Thermoplasmata archaeon]
DGVDVPDSSSLSIKGSITISFWMNFTNIPSIKYPILKKRDAGTDSYQIEMINTGKMRFLVDTGSAGMISTTTGLNDGKWHFVTATWDQSIMKIYVDAKLDATPVTKTGKMVDTPDKMTIGYGRRVQGGISYWDYYDGLIDDLRISNIARSAKEIKDAYENSTPIAKRFANLTSNTISLPLGMKWDTFSFSKTQPQNTFLNISILNAINDQPIPGTPKFINEGEFDLSYLNPISYPSIKLSADFKGNSDFTSTLHYWGVSWNTSNTWKDTIFGGEKVEHIDWVNIEVQDGEVRFNAPSSLISAPIFLPENSHYDTLTINKIESEDTQLDVSVLDANTNVNISGFENLSEALIDLSTIDILKYTAIKLKATFEETEPGTAVLYDWSLNWTENIPKIETITSQPTVNRTHQLIIGINITYRPELINKLTLLVEHMSPSSNTWQSKYVSNIAFVTDRWQCILTPALDAELGFYSFRFTCNNLYQRFDTYVELDFIEVINNKPTRPVVMITPIEPQTKDDLTVIIKNAQDTETSRNKLKYMYRWYRNNFHISMFNDQTSIQNSATAKDEVWRCEVYPFDGDDLG